MLVSFFIVFREGIEAALVVGIIASYLNHTGRKGWLPAVWIGVLLAISASLLVGTALELVSAEFPQRQMELFEACVGFFATGVLSFMVLWMKKMTKSIGSHLREAVDRAVGESKNQVFALVLMVFLAVAREGLETLFFLLALFQQSDSVDAPAGALAGLAVSVIFGIGLYQGSVKINLKHFFQLTSVLIIFVTAGILANAIKALHEAGVWNYGQDLAYDLSGKLPADSSLGSILSGTIGYQDTPTVSSLSCWSIYLIVALTLYFHPQKPTPSVKSRY
jgi:high-affinity iron transporter